MSDPNEKLLMLNPDGSPTKTRITRLKYEPYREAILACLREVGDEGMYFKDLPESVRVRLPEALLPQLGKVMWHVTLVKLDLEGRGEVERIAKIKPQKLRLKKR
jgi:hypothetical protein